MDCNIWFSMTPRNVWSAQLQIECWACLTLLLLADKSNRSKTSVSSRRELTFLWLESRKYTCHFSTWLDYKTICHHYNGLIKNTFQLGKWASPRLNCVNTSSWPSFLFILFFFSRELHFLSDYKGMWKF